VTEGSWHWDSK